MPYLVEPILDHLERCIAIAETPHRAFAFALPDSVSVPPLPKGGRPLTVDGARPTGFNRADATYIQIPVHGREDWLVKSAESA